MKNIAFLHQYFFPFATWGLLAGLVPHAQTARTAAAVQLASDNAAIPASYIFEINEQTVNDIFLNTIASGIYTFDSLQQATLESIAFQCPLTGGTAVFRARGLLSLVGDYDFGDDVVNCQEVGNRSANGDALSPGTPAELKVFPNPGKGVFTVVLPAHERGRLLLTDLNGKVVSVQKTNGETRYTLDLSSQHNGIYICRFSAGEHMEFVTRLALLK